jgi:hypothetical protein
MHVSTSEVQVHTDRLKLLYIFCGCMTSQGAGVSCCAWVMGVRDKSFEINYVAVMLLGSAREPNSAFATYTS